MKRTRSILECARPLALSRGEVDSSESGRGLPHSTPRRTHKHPIRPVFKSEAEERAFWRKNDSTEFLDWSTAERTTFPRLKPSTRTISLRLPEAMVDGLKMLANKKDVPYQSLLKIYLAERLQAELQGAK